MSGDLNPIEQALVRANREHRLVAYACDDQSDGAFCCGWFLRFDDDRAIFLDVPRNAFGGDEIEVLLDSIHWITTDSPYLRGLEQLWLVGDPYHQASKKAYSEYEYIETVLNEAWENGQVVSTLHETSDAWHLSQVSEIAGEFVCLQDLDEDDASSQGLRWTSMRNLKCVVKDSELCFKMEALLGMPNRLTQTADR